MFTRPEMKVASTRMSVFRPTGEITVELGCEGEVVELVFDDQDDLVRFWVAIDPQKVSK